MFSYFIDFVLVAACVIGITAVNGVVTNGIGEKWFGGKRHSHIFDQSRRIQSGWNQVGGNKKR
ncbi:hypothetical protein QUF81_22150 [Peribacillus simplex]|jgi:hypothetical protein|uniref:Uncharacterized protein n=1 Tax=Peribacillus simplex TaxID=1478 RepID=A0AAW7ITR5_9BACI|nr:MULTISPECIES: hypothetical protein [Peribacillus]SNT35444.1 hypothetical protein SAMN05444672_11666 [Bacillus sp. OK838]AMM92147.1 hypothetical protein UP17_05985 [Peribacillus simplex]MDM5295816.1 hypothetical protein [Peribacillus simplex]MDM5454821.1 hypothetical protein [Peribacillus simplex]MDV7766433.1 FAD:protein FMN transferase [Peribacillus sp. CSMR9]